LGRKIGSGLQRIRKVLGTDVLTKAFRTRLFPGGGRFIGPSPPKSAAPLAAVVHLAVGVEFLPLGRLDFMSDCRLLPSVLPWRCFPTVRHMFQHPQPTVVPAVLSSHPHAPEMFTPSSPQLRRHMREIWSWKTYRTDGRTENLGVVSVHIFDL
jgi:hypothetical protein